MEQHVYVTPLNLIGQDTRGSTYEYQVRKNSDYILITRKQGTVSGNTYHEGIKEATNPKTFVLISGKIEFSFRHINENQHHTIIIENPSIIKIQPLVTHSMQALSDIIVLECNSIADIQGDRYKKNVIKTVDAIIE